MRKSIIMTLALALAFMDCLPVHATVHATVQLIDEPADFLAQAIKRWYSLKRVPRVQDVDIEVGSVGFLPLDHLVIGQDEISVDNMLAKLEEHISFGNVEWTAGGWELNHDQKRSLVSENDPIEVIKGPSGYVIIDGHHDFFLSLYLGSDTIPVLVKDDLSSLSPSKFWKELASRKLIYMRSSVGELAKFGPKLENMIDNPERFLVAMLALKVTGQQDLESFKIDNVKGPKDAVWIKVNSSVAFIEFHLALVLRAHGIKYDPKWGNKIPADVVEDARKVIAAAVKAKEVAIVPIIPTAQLASHLRTDQNSLKKFLRRQQVPPRCHSIF